ncbi:hypothetical protein J6590_002284 [Homalodisca vitripennis]|nr:hypothetical protein J6590_002284 [Homalodisca vitripennis]
MRVTCELVPRTQFIDEVIDPDGVPSRYTEVDNEKLKARTALAFAFYNSRMGPPRYTEVDNEKLKARTALAFAFYNSRVTQAVN